METADDDGRSEVFAEARDMDRYEPFLDPTDTWVVFDTIEDVPAELDGEPLVGLTRDKVAEAMGRLKAEAEREHENAADGVTTEVHVIETSIPTSAWNGIANPVS